MEGGRERGCLQRSLFGKVNRTESSTQILMWQWCRSLRSSLGTHVHRVVLAKEEGYHCLYHKKDTAQYAQYQQYHSIISPVFLEDAILKCGH